MDKKVVTQVEYGFEVQYILKRVIILEANLDALNNFILDYRDILKINAGSYSV